MKEEGWKRYRHDQFLSQSYDPDWMYVDSLVYGNYNILFHTKLWPYTRKPTFCRTLILNRSTYQALGPCHSVSDDAYQKPGQNLLRLDPEIRPCDLGCIAIPPPIKDENNFIPRMLYRPTSIILINLCLSYYTDSITWCGYAILLF